MRSWRPEHFTVRSGSKPVTEYPRSGIPFSPEASRSPSPQAKNPLGNKYRRNSFLCGQKRQRKSSEALYWFFVAHCRRGPMARGLNSFGELWTRLFCHMMVAEGIQFFSGWLAVGGG